MHVAMAYLIIEMPEIHSLKEKRSVIRPIIKRVGSKFNVSIAEIDNLDSWQVSGVGLACVSNSQRHAEEMMQTIVDFIERNLNAGYVAEIQTDVAKY